MIATIVVIHCNGAPDYRSAIRAVMMEMSFELLWEGAVTTYIIYCNYYGPHAFDQRDHHSM